MSVIDISKLSNEANEGLRRLCEDAKIPAFGIHIDKTNLQYFIHVLKCTQDNPDFFPKGKWAIIQQLEMLLQTRMDNPAPRKKIEEALCLAEEFSGYVDVEIIRGSAESEWDIRLRTYDKDNVDVLLKYVPRIKRKRPYPSCNDIHGYANYKGIPVELSNVDRCEIQYEEYEEEEQEMAPTGKMVKVKKKRAITHCPDSDIVAPGKEEDGRKVRP